jgi:phosphoglucosamine mutase
VAKELFGTDGIRGLAGEYPLDPGTVYAFGVALGDDARAAAASPEIVIGTDTRESGPWIAELVAGASKAAAGACATPA